MVKKLLNNFSVVLAFAVNIIISFVYSLIVPNAIGVVPYGHYQYFTMLIAFAGLFHFGVIWGYYLKYGGKNYEDLDESVFSSQFRIFLFSQIIISVVGALVSLLSVCDADKRFVFLCFFIYIPLSNLKQYVLYILLLSSKLKEYSLFIVSERLMFLTISVILVLLKTASYKPFIITELSIQLIFCLLVVLKYRDFTVKNFDSYKNGFEEITDNLKLGVAITFSEVFSMMIISSFRMVTEAYWSIEMFSQISLSLSISNCVSTIASAFSYVLFPNLRRQDEKHQKETYVELRTVIIALFSLILIAYPLLRKIVEIVLPKYDTAAYYLIYFLPICMFTTKAMMLTGTFLKNLFKQRMLFVIELITMLITVCSSLIVAYTVNNLELAVIILLLIVMLKSTISDIIVSKCLDVRCADHLVKELIMAFLSVIIYRLSFNVIASIMILLTVYGFAFGKEIISMVGRIKSFYEKDNKEIA